MNLKDVRDAIDFIDAGIVKLLGERMEQALLARRLKTEIEDGGRENEIFESIDSKATAVLGSPFLHRVFKEIINESKTIQGKASSLIAFQGAHGAYGEVAAMTWNETLVPIPCRGFAQVFDRVESGVCDYGIVPVENTLGGVVGEVNNLLIGTGLKVIGAVELRVRHCLLALRGADHRDIRTVYSHPQAIAQCRQFIARNKLDAVSFHDTAGAAKMLSEERRKGCATTSSRLCASLYGLDILKEGIEDLEQNMTRFLVLAREAAAEAGDKCSIVFTTAHKAGTLFRVLEAFAGKDINLTRIESIPNRPGDYVFFLDFMGSDNDPRVIKALDHVEKITSEFKVMGCYKERNSQ